MRLLDIPAESPETPRCAFGDSMCIEGEKHLACARLLYFLGHVKSHLIRRLRVEFCTVTFVSCFLFPSPLPRWCNLTYRPGRFWGPRSKADPYPIPCPGKALGSGFSTRIPPRRSDECQSFQGININLLSISSMKCRDIEVEISKATTSTCYMLPLVLPRKFASGRVHTLCYVPRGADP